MSLLLVRHGETPLNVARVLQPAHTPLSPNGRAQAQRLAQRLASRTDRKVAGVLSSSLPRALATANAVATACGLAVLTTPLLHERNFGDLRGRPYNSLDHDPLTAEAAPPGGESLATFAARCNAAWQHLLAVHQALGGPLVVVTHGLVLRQWLAGGTLALPPGMALPTHLGNTALTEAEAQPPHRVLRLACTAHLLADSHDDAAGLVGG